MSMVRVPVRSLRPVRGRSNRPALVAVIAAVVVLLVPSVSSATPPRPGGAGDREAARALRRTPVVEVFERSRDAVVNISCTEQVVVRGRRRSLFDDFFAVPVPPRTITRQSVGSGFVIHEQGYVVTNAHVVARTGAQQRVIFADGRTYEAEIVASDAEADLAVLKIESDEPLPVLPLGRSDDLMVGETVVAIGNPFGFGHTVTSGVVSALDRELPVSPQVVFTGLVQTDASINPGNSGGPLLNVLGELIGVNTAIRGDAENIGFAIPVDRLRTLLPDLLDVERRYGVEAGLVLDSVDAPRVLQVRGGSPADRAGVRRGDLLRAIDGRPVREGIDWDIALIGRRAGATVPVELERDGRPIAVEIELAPRPEPDGTMLAWSKLGLRLVPLPPDLAAPLGLRRPVGLVVEELRPDGPAERAGLRRADVLLQVGRYYVSRMSDLGELLDGVDPGDGLGVGFLRVARRSKEFHEAVIEVR